MSFRTTDPAFFNSLVSSHRRLSSSHDFMQAISNGVWERVAINTGTYNQATVTESAHPGQMQNRCNGTTANSGYGMISSYNVMVLAGGETSKRVAFFPVVTAGIRDIFGWFSSYTAPTDPANCVMFDRQGATLRGMIIKASASPVYTGTTYTVSAGVWYTQEIEVSEDGGTVYFRLYNDAGTLLWSDSIASPENMPVVALGHGHAASFASPGATTVLVTVDYLELDVRRDLLRGAV